MRKITHWKYVFLCLLLLIMGINACKTITKVEESTKREAKALTESISKVINKDADKADKTVKSTDKTVDKTVKSTDKTVDNTTETTAKKVKGAVATHTYDSAENDPLKTRIYTLKNGLKVYLSVNKDEPRINTAIAVRAGAKNDPRDATGLAHYLEHMLFKGTDKIATVDWEKEKVMLQKISDLYEAHRKETDPEKKKAIYQQIDSLSFAASKHAAPNEYDKMISSLGAKGTNAYTFVDQTVYINDIPANELEKWLTIESERFRMVVLRLFHTELETVYEEFNMGQDNDTRKVYKAIFKNLFKKHPYNISTIGLGEHLKNPSHVEIQKYFDEYYVANNIAICLSGDLDPAKTIKLIEKHFGKLRQQRVPDFTFEPEEPITKPIEVDVMGSTAEYLNLVYRFEGAGSRDALFLNLMDGILQNGQAGLMDLNLIQQQKILSGRAFQFAMADYSLHVISGTPREGQSLDDVKKLVLEQIEHIKKGEFDEDLIKAVIKNYKLDEMKGYESNRARVGAFVDAFILKRKWQDVVDELAKLDKITKEDIVKFANENYKDNYLAVYKRNGEDKNVMKVEKPPITELELNRAAQSDFAKEFEKMESGRLTPAFVNYKEAIEDYDLDNGVNFYYIKNKLNPTFSLYYIFDMGKLHDKELGLAISYLPYLGTDKYTAAELQKEFYKLGLSFDVSSGDRRVYVTLSGLEESFEEGVKLFEHILANVQPDKTALNNLTDGILKKRVDAKKDKNTIFWSALFDYGKYGKESSFKHRLSEQELKAITPEQLTEKIKKLSHYKHYVFYYGQNSPKQTMATLNTYHKTQEKPLSYPEPVKFEELVTTKDKVYFVDYDMVQAQILMLSKDKQFDKTLYPPARVFGEYFGSGLSSIVFQEIREARALAYSAFSSFSVPREADKSHYTYGFLAVQSDKLKDAVTAMRNLMNDMPKAEKQFESAKTSVMKKMESERITKSRIFFDYLRAKDRGLDYDVRKDVYEKAKSMSMDELATFFNEHVKGKQYNFLIMGKKENLNMDYLKSIGDFEELTLEELFGY